MGDGAGAGGCGLSMSASYSDCELLTTCGKTPDVSPVACEIWSLSGSRVGQGDPRQPTPACPKVALIQIRP